MKNGDKGGRPISESGFETWVMVRAMFDLGLRPLAVEFITGGATPEILLELKQILFN
jgi:hypothetical protein